MTPNNNHSPEDLERLKRLSVEDVRAAREYERLTGESAAEWVELPRKRDNFSGPAER